MGGRSVSNYVSIWVSMEQRRGDEFYLQVEEFNRCDHYAVNVDVLRSRRCDRYAVDVDVPKLENYDEIRSCLYKFSFDELMEAENSFLEKKYLFLTKLECRIFGKFTVLIQVWDANIKYTHSYLGSDTYH